jgi:hypothetical protein
MTKLVDTCYAFQPPGSSRPGRYGLRIYAHRGRKSVILTQLADNLGMSVTNVAEQLATKLVRVYQLDPRNTIWVEHYPPADGAPETFDALLFAWRGRTAHDPVWRRKSRRWVTYWSGEKGTLANNYQP